MKSHQPPADVELPALVRSFKLRSGRLGPVAEAAHARVWPRVGFDIPRNTHGDIHPTLDLIALFDSPNPVTIEIGFGMGDATAQLAAADPSHNVLAVDVHVPGIAILCKYIEDLQLGNVRIGRGDVIDLMRDHLAPESLAGARIFFPDPWPKKKHHKRRLISVEFLDLLASRLQPGSVVHFATDWSEYADWTREAFGAHAAFSVSETVPSRPTTRYEQAGIRAGRTSQDLAFVRR